MDGFKRRLKDSLQFRLSLTLSISILSIAIVAGFFAFYTAFDEAHELQDDVLRQVATLFDRHGLNPPDKGDAGNESDSEKESRVFVQIVSPNINDNAKNGLPTLLPLPTTLADGMQTVIAGSENYRVFVKKLSTGQRLAVAQETDIRDEIAYESSLRTLMPFLILIPVLLLVVADLIRKIFKPITTLSREIDSRGDQELHPIPVEPLPSEIIPFVGAINRLLARVELSVGVQRRFVADAAHELRSPLTALSLQGERLANAEMSVNARERLATLRHGIDRTKILLEQLLTLAKVHAETERIRTNVSLQKVYRRVLEDALPLAESKHIDIGVTSSTDFNICANEVDLIVLVKNLVDNAIRYTPENGRVDLSIVTGKNEASLVVEDNGPGIPESEWHRVFDPFYRIPGNHEIGSGLGLSIVNAIVSHLGASIHLGFTNKTQLSGLRVAVTFRSTNR
ncbi:ATP-binding protein [Herbaspirillum rhizosphaerae]|uniref:histidine kinase n=1 Tax=Herbaspirillum rhizosphaerae TaxID=346179 RepID=A0ABW8ZE04_9BURK